MKKFVATMATLGLGLMGAIALSMPAQAADVCTPSDQVTHVVHHEAVTHTVHHDAVTHEVIITDSEAYDETVPATYKTIHHDAVTHIVHHDAVLSDPVRYSWTGGKDEPVWPSEAWQIDHKTYDGSPVNTILQKGSHGHADYFYWEQHIVTDAYDETVIDCPAWDEQVVDVEEHIVHHDSVTHTEIVTDKDAWDEVIVDKAAWDETVIDKDAVTCLEPTPTDTETPAVIVNPPAPPAPPAPPVISEVGTAQPVALAETGASPAAGLLIAIGSLGLGAALLAARKRAISKA